MGSTMNDELSDDEKEMLALILEWIAEDCEDEDEPQQRSLH